MEGLLSTQEGLPAFSLHNAKAKHIRIVLVNAAGYSSRNRRKIMLNLTAAAKWNKSPKLLARFPLAAQSTRQLTAPPYPPFPTSHRGRIPSRSPPSPGIRSKSVVRPVWDRRERPTLAPNDPQRCPETPSRNAPRDVDAFIC